MHAGQAPAGVWWPKADPSPEGPPWQRTGLLLLLFRSQSYFCKDALLGIPGAWEPRYPYTELRTALEKIRFRQGVCYLRILGKGSQSSESKDKWEKDSDSVSEDINNWDCVDK